MGVGTTLWGRALLGVLAKQRCHRLRDARTFAAHSWPDFEDLLHVKNPGSAVDAAAVSLHASQPHEHRLIRRGDRAVPRHERCVFDQHPGLRVIARKEHATAVLVDVQTVNLRRTVTRDEDNTGKGADSGSHGLPPWVSRDDAGTRYTRTVERDPRHGASSCSARGKAQQPDDAREQA